MASATALQEVQSFYLAYYGRPADPSGLTYWADRYDAEGGLASLVDAFGTSAEATELLANKTTAEKVNAVYQQLFGRDAESGPTGLDFYVSQIESGAITLQSLARDVFGGATGDDALVVANKVQVADAFTAELAADPELAAEYVGIAATTGAKSIIATIDATAASVTAATAQINVVLAVTTSALTTGVDTIAGTAGRDKISGGVTSLSSTDTLQVTDQIDGGDGNDTLTLAVSKNFDGLTVGTGYIKNVEKLALNNPTVTSYTFSSRGITDVDSLEISGPISVSGISSLDTAITVKSIATSSDVSIGFDGAVVSGTTDSLTLNLDTLGTAGSSSSASATTVVELQTPSVEALNLVVTGSNFVDLTSTGVNALTISGTGNLSLVDQTTLTLAGMTKGVGSGVKSIDASAMSGNLTAQLLAATSINTVKLGSGTNTIYATDTDLAGNATITGTSGTDTLVLNTTGAQTYGFSLTGIETIRLGSIAGGTLSFSGAKASDVSSVYLSNSAANSITTNLVSMGATNLGITVQAASSTTDSAAHTLTTDSEGAVSVGVAVSSTATSSANQQAADNITASKATSLTLSVAKFGDYDGDVTATKATTVTVSGDGTVDGNATLKLAAAKSLVLNQTNKDTTWDVEYEKGVATASVLTSLDVTAKGTMTITTTDDLVALETLTVSTDGHFNTLGATDLDAISTLTVSGGENASEFTAAGELGGDTLAYGVTVTASGLKNDLNLSGIAVGASQAITVNVGDVNGNVTLGALEVHSAASTTTTASGSVTVNGRNHGDSFNNTGTAAADDTLAIGAVTAKTISIDVDGAATVTTGILTGRTINVQGNNTKSLTVNSSSSLDTTAEIAVRDSLTFYGSDLSATVLDVDISSGSTAFTADLKGGILGDLYDFNSTNTGQTSITLTGDLVGTGNTVSVTSSASTATAGQAINISGLVGANNTTLVGSAGKDTITGGAGVDSIDGGLGADTIYTGSGNDFVFIETGDSGTVSTVLTNASGTTTDSWGTSYTVTSGHRVSTTSMDKVMDFSIGDTIGIYDRSTPVVTDTSNAIGSAYVASSVGKYAGTYDATGQTFTFGESGVDSILIYDGDGTGSGTTYYGVVLVGYTTTFTADTETTNTSFTGLVGSAS